MNKAAVIDKLFDAGVHPDTLSKRGNEWTFRRTFFYTHGVTSKMYAEKVKEAGFKVTDHGEVFKPFRGGASAANSSHWFVKFTEN